MTGHRRSAVLAPPASIAVIGGGQLGRMFIQAAQRLGFDAGVLAETADAPAVQVASWSIIGRSNERVALRRLADRASAVTVEFENVSAPGLRWLDRWVPVRPGWRTVWVSQDRHREKTFLARHGLPIAPWRPVRSRPELADAAAWASPIILKTVSSGYDGKGQVRVDRAEDASTAWRSLREVPCVAEALVDFAAEVSVVVVRGADGSALAYPVAQNCHSRHILDSTVMPADVGPIVAQEARDFALAIAQALGTVGVLTVEFFLTPEGQLLVNEIAPRPHNSGHLTIEAAITGQFEQQVRALCGLPLGSADLSSPAAMVNLLGDLWADGEPRWDVAMAADPGLKIHLYGKQAAAPGRKMGHITVLDASPDRALDRAVAGRCRLSPRPRPG